MISILISAFYSTLLVSIDEGDRIVQFHREVSVVSYFGSIPFRTCVSSVNYSSVKPFLFYVT